MSNSKAVRIPSNYNKSKTNLPHYPQLSFLCRNLRYLRENNHARVLNLLHKETPISLSQISLIYADKPQNYTN